MTLDNNYPEGVDRFNPPFLDEDEDVIIEDEYEPEEHLADDDIVEISEHREEDKE